MPLARRDRSAGEDGLMAPPDRAAPLSETG